MGLSLQAVLGRPASATGHTLGLLGCISPFRKLGHCACPLGTLGSRWLAAALPITQIPLVQLPCRALQRLASPHRRRDGCATGTAWFGARQCCCNWLHRARCSRRRCGALEEGQLVFNFPRRYFLGQTLQSWSRRTATASSLAPLLHGGTCWQPYLCPPPAHPALSSLSSTHAPPLTLLKRGKWPAAGKGAWAWPLTPPPRCL